MFAIWNYILQIDSESAMLVGFIVNIIHNLQVAYIGIQRELPLNRKLCEPEWLGAVDSHFGHSCWSHQHGIAIGSKQAQVPTEGNK